MSTKSLSKILCWAVGWKGRYRFDSKHAINQTKGPKGWHRSADSILDLQYWILHWLLYAVYLQHLSRYICLYTSIPVLKLCRRARTSFFTLWVSECTLWVLKKLCCTIVKEREKPTTIVANNKREFYVVRHIINKSMLGTPQWQHNFFSLITQ